MILWMCFPRIKIKLLDYLYILISLFFWMISPFSKDSFLEKKKNIWTQSLGIFPCGCSCIQRSALSWWAPNSRGFGLSNSLFELVVLFWHFTNLRKMEHIILYFAYLSIFYETPKAYNPLFYNFPLLIICLETQLQDFGIILVTNLTFLSFRRYFNTTCERSQCGFK